jgi:hypothetical protein
MQTDNSLLARLGRIREVYGVREPNDQMPYPITTSTLESSSVDRLNATMSRLKAAQDVRTAAQVHLEQLIASLGSTSKQAEPHSAVRATDNEKSEEESAVGASSGGFFSTSPARNAVAVLQPRRVRSQCRPATLAIRLLVPGLLRFPILFPSIDTVGLTVVMPLDALMESCGRDLALSLLGHVADQVARPALETSREMDSSAALMSISLRGVREALLRLQNPVDAASEFCVVFPSTQRRSCVASVASAVESSPPYIVMDGLGMLYDNAHLRLWSQRLWALLRLHADGSASDERPVVLDMFVMEREALRTGGSHH